MSLLRALRAYVGLGPDEDYENRYLDSYGDRVDIDLTSRDRGTTREFAQSGAVSTSRPGPERRVGQEAVTSRRTSSPRLESPMEGGGQGDTAEPERSTTVQSRSDHHRESLRSSSAPSTDEDGDSVAGRNGPETSESETNQQGAVVRSIDSVRTRPKTVAPESFADAKTIADDFKFGTPIVLNLQELDRDLARRLIDFASGICYGLDGSMEKLAAQVFLLTPEGIEVSESDRLRIEQRGYAR